MASAAASNSPVTCVKSVSAAELPALSVASVLCIDKRFVHFSSALNLNFCSIAEPHTTSRLRIDLNPRPPSNIQTPPLRLRNTRLDVSYPSAHRQARFSNCLFHLRNLLRACDLPTARRASLSSVAPVSRVRDSGSTSFSITNHGIGDGPRHRRAQR